MPRKTMQHKEGWGFGCVVAILIERQWASDANEHESNVVYGQLKLPSHNLHLGVNGSKETFHLGVNGSTEMFHLGVNGS